MNIKKSRIIQIIKEEMQKLSEDDGSDDGIAPVSLTRPPRPTAPSDELAYVEIQIRLAKDKLMELEAIRAQLAGEEPESPEPSDDTEFASVPVGAQNVFDKKMRS
jgi:hypothetical protein|tara:strand:+ start:1828 stop:2142 length:315 start_codon:yes stop_codon:yes gene_type:complete